jgi:hypothetical protein
VGREGQWMLFLGRCDQIDQGRILTGSIRRQEIWGERKLVEQVKGSGDVCSSSVIKGRGITGR